MILPSIKNIFDKYAVLNQWCGGLSEFKNNSKIFETFIEQMTSYPIKQDEEIIEEIAL